MSRLRSVYGMFLIAQGLSVRTEIDGDGDQYKTSMTNSHKSRAGIPSMRKPESIEITSDSVELCETAVCFLHIKLT